MRVVTLSALLTFSGISASLAAQPPSQVFDYIKPILEHELTTAQDAWNNSGHGGYVFRFYLDVTGDGNPEMFLASTLYFQNQYGIWRPYLATKDGGYRPFNYEFSETSRAGLNLFGTELFIENAGAMKSFLTFGSDRGKNYVGRYSFQDTQVAFDRKEVDAATFNQLKSSPSVKRVVPEVRGVLLVDLLRNPNAEWKPIDFDRNAPDPNGYFIATDDAERVKGLGNFTPDLALRWHASAAAGKTPLDASAVAIPQPPPEPRQSPDASPLAVPKTSSPAPVVAETSAATAERRAPVWPWLVGIVALLVIVAVALKRRA